MLPLQRNGRTLPAIIACAVVLAKAAAIVAARFSSYDVTTINRLILIDHWPIVCANATVALFFDQRRIAPTSGEMVVFDIALLAFSALEWYVGALLIKGAFRSLRRQGLKAN